MNLLLVLAFLALLSCAVAVYPSADPADIQLFAQDVKESSDLATTINYWSYGYNVDVKALAEAFANRLGHQEHVATLGHQGLTEYLQKFRGVLVAAFQAATAQ